MKVTIMPKVQHKNLGFKNATVPNNIGIHLYNIYINTNNSKLISFDRFFKIYFLSALLSLLTLCRKNSLENYLNTLNLCHLIWHFGLTFGTLTLNHS